MAGIERKSKVRKWFLLVLIIAFGATLFLLIDRIPPGADTAGRMLKVRFLIEEHVDRYARLPRDLEEVAMFARETNIEFKKGGTKDEWGNPIIYQKHSDNWITLQSLGHDTRAGGEGRNADVIVKFQIKIDTAKGNATEQEDVEDY